MLTAPITAAPDVETLFRGPALPSTRPADTADAPGGDTDTPEAHASEAEAVSEASAPEAFIPDTAEKVDWVLGKIADARARAARIRENAELMAKAEEREADTLEWRFGPALQAFARQELAGGKRKSLRLYNGVLGWRVKPAGISVTDEAAALSWARENLPAAVAERLDKKALSEALTQTGEVLDFARLTAAEDVFYIK